MNEFKNPTSLVAGSNIIFSIGSFLYLYKKNEQLQNELNDMKKNFQTMTTKLQQYNNDDIQNEEILKTMYKDVKMLKNNTVDDLEDELKLIKDTLEENDIYIKSPIKIKKNKKKKKYESSNDNSSESEELIKKKTKKKTKEELEEDDIINKLRLKHNN